MGEKGEPVPLTDKSSELFSLSDEELIARIRLGSEKALNIMISRYSGTVTAVSKKYFSDFLTPDDWFQEGMLGLLFAISAFDPESTASFATYSSVCIKNRLNTAWKRANNSKNALLNDAVMLDESVCSVVDSPEEDYIKNEELDLFEQKYISVLSETEKSVLLLYLAGYRYEQIATRTGLSKKSVDNALFRAKQKIQKLYLL